MQPVLQEHVPLAPRHSLRAQAAARWLVEVHDVRALAGTLASSLPGPLLVLGEGSNVLFTGDYDGVVLVPKFLGIEESGDGLVTIAAGENWHSFVRWSLASGYCGLENLALIPGSVGAAPIQNIGAYGVELDRFVVAVRAWDRDAGELLVLDQDACGFGYRDSVFKRHPDRFIVVGLVLRLRRTPDLVLDYSGVREELERDGVDNPSAIDVADAVERLRKRKLPDPASLPNAGSFFKNPVVSAATASSLQGAETDMPAWPVLGGVKLSAAWLLERCGFKGYREGDAGFAGIHALVLVNYGSATGAELYAVAERARSAVADRFGVMLEPEPRII